MACIVTVRTEMLLLHMCMACIGLAHVGMAYILLVRTEVPLFYILMANIVMTGLDMAHIQLVHTEMPLHYVFWPTYIVMTYLDMAGHSYGTNEDAVGFAYSYS